MKSEIEIQAAFETLNLLTFKEKDDYDKGYYAAIQWVLEKGLLRKLRKTRILSNFI